MPEHWNALVGLHNSACIGRAASYGAQRPDIAIAVEHSNSCVFIGFHSPVERWDNKNTWCSEARLGRWEPTSPGQSLEMSGLTGGIRFCGRVDPYRLANHKKRSRRRLIRSDIATGQGGTQQRAVGIRTASELCSAQWISSYRGFTQKQCN
ncbi:hypothetical protein ALQ79_200417 [Pseudomonas amygdali pv. lachrymans]|nr:hypothetical protein ALQ79_200417 [Pseudomonas amygdali pv. lachrymans]